MILHAHRSCRKFPCACKIIGIYACTIPISGLEAQMLEQWTSYPRSWVRVPPEPLKIFFFSGFSNGAIIIYLLHCTCTTLGTRGFFLASVGQNRLEAKLCWLKANQAPCREKKPEGQRALIYCSR